MDTANSRFASVLAWMPRIAFFYMCCALGNPAGAVGTAAGTVIENTAIVNYDLAGTSLTLQSNTTTIAVAERIDVSVTLQSPQTLVAPAETGRALLFTVTNTGNGTEPFQLAIDSAVTGDDFDPTPAVPAIYFDTDGSGDFNAGDLAYTPGSNDPDLQADQSCDQDGKVHLSDDGLGGDECPRLRRVWGDVAEAERRHRDEAEVDPLAVPAPPWIGLEASERSRIDRLDQRIRQCPDRAEQHVHADRAQ